MHHLNPIKALHHRKSKQVINDPINPPPTPSDLPTDPLGGVAPACIGQPTESLGVHERAVVPPAGPLGDAFGKAVGSALETAAIGALQTAAPVVESALAAEVPKIESTLESTFEDKLHLGHPGQIPAGANPTAPSTAPEPSVASQQTPEVSLPGAVVPGAIAPNAVTAHGAKMAMHLSSRQVVKPPQVPASTAPQQVDLMARRLAMAKATHPKGDTDEKPANLPTGAQPIPAPAPQIVHKGPAPITPLFATSPAAAAAAHNPVTTVDTPLATTQETHGQSPAAAKTPSAAPAPNPAPPVVTAAKPAPKYQQHNMEMHW